MVVRKGSKEEKGFRESRRSELRGLIRDGTLIQMDEQDIEGTPRIFGSRFVDELKKVEEHPRRKSRLAAQNYGDEGASTIATKAPTVQRFSQRLYLCIAASSRDMSPYTRDVNQAYIQSHTAVERDVFIRPPRELNLGPN